MGLTNELIQGINFMINRAIDKAPYDKVYTGVIRAISGGKYTVEVNRNLYENVDYIGSKTLIIGQVIRVLVPQNQFSNMFILG